MAVEVQPDAVRLDALDERDEGVDQVGIGPGVVLDREPEVREPLALHQLPLKHRTRHGDGRLVDRQVILLGRGLDRGSQPSRRGVPPRPPRSREASSPRSPICAPHTRRAGSPLFTRAWLSWRRSKTYMALPSACSLSVSASPSNCGAENWAPPEMHRSSRLSVLGEKSGSTPCF